MATYLAQSVGNWLLPIYARKPANGYAAYSIAGPGMIEVVLYERDSLRKFPVLQW